MALREVRHVRELPFASLPLLFALHQLTESVVWAHADDDSVPAWAGRVAALAYVGFALEVLPEPVRVVVHPHALEYATGLSHGDILSVDYVVAVIGPALLSGYRSIVAFGVINMVGLLFVAWAYPDAFASPWCVYAALASVLVVLHMVRRRRLPDADRLEGLRQLAHVG